MKTIAPAFLILVACSSDPVSSAGPATDSGATADRDVTGPDAGTATETGAGDGGGDAAEACSAAREQLLKPVDKVSTGDVLVLAQEGAAKILYVDASAGGTQGASSNPRLYINLETATRVEVTDRGARASTAWDLALKRPILFTNGGDGGPGKGAAIFHLDKPFEQVSAADVSGAKAEAFFDANCEPALDPTGAVKTSFHGWYDYDQATNSLTPKPGTWIVRGGTGKAYKVAILSYYAVSDGGVGQAGGRYRIKVAPL